MKLHIGDIVEWTSQARGYRKKKVGVIVAIVPAGFRPDRVDFADLYRGPGCGWGRKDDSFVVKANGKHYWPLARKLVAVSTQQQLAEVE